MHVPDLSHQQFLVLLTLLDAGRTVPQIATAIGGTKRRVASVIDSLHPLGLIAKHDVSLRTDRPRRREVVYSATPAGKRAWSEAADFYLVWIDRARNGLDGPCVPAGAVRTAAAVPPRCPAETYSRYPTIDEERRIVAAAADDCPGFALLLRALRHIDAGLGDVCPLEIRHVDLPARYLRIGRRRLPIRPELAVVLRQAIGARESGPLFVNHVGRAWNRRAVRYRLALYRRKAGLPEEINLNHRLRTIRADQQQPARAG